MTYRTEYQAEFPPPDPQYDYAFRIWLRFHVRTENFDRGLRGVWSPYDREVWLPYPECAGTSRAFAAAEARDARERIRQAGIPHERSMWAKDRVERLGHTEATRILERIETEASE